MELQLLILLSITICATANADYSVSHPNHILGGAGKFYVCHHGKPTKTCVANSITSPENCYVEVVADPQCGNIFHFHSKAGEYECVCIVKGQESTVSYIAGASADWNVYIIKAPVFPGGTNRVTSGYSWEIHEHHHYNSDGTNACTYMANPPDPNHGQAPGSVAAADVCAERCVDDCTGFQVHALYGSCQYCTDSLASQVASPGHPAIKYLYFKLRKGRYTLTQSGKSCWNQNIGAQTWDQSAITEESCYEACLGAPSCVMFEFYRTNFCGFYSIICTNPTPHTDLPNRYEIIRAANHDSHWVAKGRHGGDSRCDSGDCSTQFELDSELHGVRCCGGESSTGKFVKNEGCSVFGASLQTNSNYCQPPVIYSVAFGVCQVAGARLCTIQELKDNCAARTGCGLDFRTVWSSDADPNLGHSPITTTPTLKPSARSTPTRHYAEPRFHKRSKHPCTEVSGDCDSIHALNSAIHAVSCCKAKPSYFWFHQSSIPRCRKVWSAAGQGLKHENQCTKGTWYEAHHVCEANGARLCSRQELSAGCAQHTGCQFDGLLNWSMD